MVVDKCDVIYDYATIFSVDGEIPKNTNAIVFDGEEYLLMPVYECEGSFAIRGSHDMLGKQISFVKAKEAI